MSSAAVETYKHIARVRQLLGSFAVEMIRRGDVHDASKFEPVEMEPLERMQALIDREGQAPFGSPEYKRRTDLLGPMVEHHRANNSHHPEFYPDGIAGMDLFDLVEMFFDWKAASERGGESAMNLLAAAVRYEVGPQLLAILRNTAERLGYAIAPPAPLPAGLARRSFLPQFTPAESAIRAATLLVEAMGADPRLTDAVVQLAAAERSVADFVDGVEKP